MLLSPRSESRLSPQVSNLPTAQSRVSGSRSDRNEDVDVDVALDATFATLASRWPRAASSRRRSKGSEK